MYFLFSLYFISINDTSGTINAYNNVKDLNGIFKACRVHFLSRIDLENNCSSNR